MAGTAGRSIKAELVGDWATSSARCPSVSVAASAEECCVDQTLDAETCQRVVAAK